jgi:putative inorganic carbon (HCO3(-)) transporter
MTLILGLTQARGAYLGLAAALIFLIILRFKFGWLVLPLFISIILGAALIFGPSVLVDKINQVQSNASSMEVRVDIWTRAIYMIEDFPITGVGIGTFNNVADAYYPFYLEAPASVPHAHNLYLQIAVDLGIPGLLSWLVLLIFMFSSSLQIYKVGIKGNMPLQKVLGASLFAALIAMSVHGFLDSATWGNRPSIIIWLILGLIAAARTQSKQD